MTPEERHACIGRLVVMALWLALALVHLDWLKRYAFGIPPAWDQALYMWTGIEFLYALLRGGLSGLLSAVLHVNPYSGPLVPLLTVPFYFVAGATRVAAHVWTLAALGVLLLATFELGRHLRSSHDGLLAAALLAGCPAIISYSRDYLFELPLAAVVTLAHLFLYASDGFSRRAAALGYGLSAGLAFLTKTMGPVFLVGPLAWIVISLRRAADRRERLINLGFSAAVAVAVAGAWVGPNIRPVTWYLFHFGFGREAAHWGPGSLGMLAPQSLLHYPSYVMNYGLSFPLALLLAIATIAGPWRASRREPAATWQKDTRSGNRFLWAWVIVGYLLITVPTNKGAERYALPLLPPLVLLGARALNLLRHRALRLTMIGAALLVATTQLAGQTLRLPWLPRHIQRGEVVLFSRESRAHDIVYHPGWQDLANDGWPMEVLPCLISRTSADMGVKSPRILVVPSHPVINENGLLYSFAVARCPNVFPVVKRNQIDRDIDHLDDHDFVLVKSGDQGPAFINERSEAVAQAMPSNPGFRLLRQFPLPDGGSLMVYQRSPGLVRSRAATSTSVDPKPSATAAFVPGIQRITLGWG